MTKFVMPLFALSWALSATAQDRYIPHITQLDSDFQSWIIIENIGTEAEAYRWDCYEADGTYQPFVLGQLEPGETQTLVALDWLSNQVTSHVTIGTEDYPSPNIRLTVAYGRKDGTGSRVHIPQMTTKAKAWRLYTGTWPTVYDAIAVVNFGDSPAEIKVIQKANDGSTIKEVTVAEGAAPLSKTKYVIGGNASEFDGSASSIFEVQSDQPIGLIALQGNLPDSTIMWVNTAQALPE